MWCENVENKVIGHIFYNRNYIVITERESKVLNKRTIVYWYQIPGQGIGTI